MPDQILIVARLSPGGSGEVSRLFGESDAGELPRALGVTRRDLFLYRDLYLHHVEFEGSAAEAMALAREREDFLRLSADLDPHVRPYDPDTWRGPADAMARRFYHWTPEERAL
ncbi:TcmI family type II polyketide cyclase [Streptosporangium vulgare]|uniref:TcmI family type II polyketide cyclase n=1 Tax=Streptosporangium vulgare TaxID=46190 RepID=A0ABV5T5H2_9ACTN